MSGVTRTLAVAAILPLLAASSAASAAILDISAAGTNGHALAYAGASSSFSQVALWVMLILAAAHFGVSLRCRTVALRLRGAQAKRRMPIRRR